MRQAWPTPAILEEGTAIEQAGQGIALGKEFGVGESFGQFFAKPPVLDQGFGDHLRMPRAAERECDHAAGHGESCQQDAEIGLPYLGNEADQHGGEEGEDKSRHDARKGAEHRADQADADNGNADNDEGETVRVEHVDHRQDEQRPADARQRKAERDDAQLRLEIAARLQRRAQPYAADTCARHCQHP